MASTNAALGSQCLTCKRRRVKCDSIQPRCLRCQKDGRECPGYEPYRWVSMHPVKQKDRTAKSGSRSPRASTVGNDTTVVLHKTAVVHRSTRLPSPYPAIPRFDVEGERRCWHINDSVEYCNNHVVPDLIPYPFARTYFMNLDEWRRAPSLLHSIVLVLVANHRIVRQISDGSAISDLYKYRGDALRELAEKINSSEKLSIIISLIGVLMVLQTEIQLSAISSWDLHLRAARAFIGQLGGIVKCWNDLPQLRMLLSLHFLVEIMSPITTPTSLLSEQELREADEDIIRVPGIEKNLLASCCPLPLPIITAITQINRLRGELGSTAATDSIPSSECQRNTLAVFASVLQQLDKFDPEAWASRIIADFPDEGMYTERSIPHFKAMELSEWTATGQCYQSSITIYLLRSASSSTRFGGDEERTTTRATKRLQAEAYSLGTALDRLFLYFGDRRSTSLRPGLWRFTMFPLFIHALELLVWQYPGPSEKAQRHYLDRMLSLGQVLGCRAMDSAVECVERAVQFKKQRGRAPAWDECFTSRSVFVI